MDNSDGQNRQISPTTGQVRWYPRDPDLSNVKNISHELARWAAAMQVAVPELKERYRQVEIDHTLKILEEIEKQEERVEYEKRLIKLKYYIGRKERWRKFYAKRIQNKIAAAIKEGKRKRADRLIQCLKKSNGT